MVRVKTVGLTLFIIIVIGVFYYVFTISSNGNGVKSLSLKVTPLDSEFRGKIISVNYDILNKNNEVVLSSKTLEGSPTTIDIIEENKIVFYPLTNQDDYYSFTINNLSSNSSLEREVIMQRAASLDVVKEGILTTNNNMSFTLKYNSFSNSEVYKNPIVCQKISVSILSVNFYNLINIDRPEELEDSGYTKCYSLGNSITNENNKKEVVFNATSWRNLNQDDFIELIVLDRDNNLLTKYKDIDLGGDNYILKWQN